jgi:glycosyltransferase involved in cell wall biosynthesis
MLPKSTTEIQFGIHVPGGSEPRSREASETPEVTVVIPTRDRWGLLSRTLARVLAQQGVVLEVVVVDDGSRDGTASRVAGLGDRRIRCVSHPEPQGVARARNRGIVEARGRWVAFLDDDDLWSPRKLTEQLATVKDADAAFVYSSALVIDAPGRILLTAPAPDPRGLANRLLIRNLIPAGPSNVIVRADLLRDLGAFDDRFQPLADWDLWIRLARAGPAARCNASHVAYMEHAGSMGTGDLDRWITEFALLADKHRSASAAVGVRFGDACVERWVALDQLGHDKRWAAARTLAAAAARHRQPELAARALGALLGRRIRTAARRVRVSGLTAPEWLRSAS